MNCHALTAAESVGYPVLLKASAGGGGRVGATDRVITGNIIWRIALMTISSRHGESESQASINAKPVIGFTS